MDQSNCLFLLYLEGGGVLPIVDYFGGLSQKGYLLISLQCTEVGGFSSDLHIIWGGRGGGRRVSSIVGYTRRLCPEGVSI